MAKISKPVRITKGTPPPEMEASRTLTRAEDSELSPLNFKVPAEFKREFKTLAAQMDISMVELMMRCFQVYKEKTI